MSPTFRLADPVDKEYEFGDEIDTKMLIGKPELNPQESISSSELMP